MTASAALQAERARTDAPAPAQPSPPRIDLPAAIARALRRAPSLELARAEITRAQALLGQIRAAWLPVLDANASYTRLDRERRNAGVRIAARDQLRGELDLSVPLVVPQRWVATSQASERVELARADLQSERREIALATAQAYLAVMAQHRVIEVNERASANAKAHSEYATLRFEGGIGNQIDALRAEQEYASGLAQLENARADLVRAQEALGILLGHDGPLDVVDQIQIDRARTLAESLQDATTQRADIRAARAEVAAARAVTDDAWADYVPFLVAEFTPFLSTPPTPSVPQSGWQAQLVLSVPLYDGARQARHDEREVLLAQSKTRLEAALRQAKSDVRVAFSNAQRADASLSAAGRAAELARDALQMAMLAYQAGATTNIEVIDAERRARDAETAAVIAEDSARKARVDLLAASGRWP